MCIYCTVGELRYLVVLAASGSYLDINRRISTDAHFLLPKERTNTVKRMNVGR